jgi:Mlc titration factor MtfA (ptsG expression regulator)
MPILILILIILAAVLIGYGLGRRRKRLREQLITAPFDPAWTAILQANLSLYDHLPEELKHKLHGLVNVFLHDKVFSGYNGLEIDDEIRVTIAAQACMLVLNRGEELYPSLKNIYVYPGAFRSDQVSSDGLVQTTETITRIGESWHRGHVVLSWQHSREGGLDDDDGHNVVYHEFAHQLDHEDGAIDGTPVLDDAQSYRNWRRVFSEEFLQLRERVSAHQASFIDPYGAVSEGEFFAVVTELFFERPREMAERHPELYDELRKFYRLDPGEWVS